MSPSYLCGSSSPSRILPVLRLSGILWVWLIEASCLDEGSMVMGISCFCTNLPPGLIQERGPGCGGIGTSKTWQREVAEKKEKKFPKVKAKVIRLRSPWRGERYKSKANNKWHFHPRYVLLILYALPPWQPCLIDLKQPQAPFWYPQSWTPGQSEKGIMESEFQTPVVLESSF